MNQKQLLSLGEAAESLSLSMWTLRAWIRAGKLRPVRLGRRVLVEPGELQRLIESGRQSAIEEAGA